MEKLETLTAEQEELKIVIRDRWINQFYDLKEINLEQLTTGVNWLYKYCGLEEPQLIIADSILDAQIKLHLLKNNLTEITRGCFENFEFENICSYGDINDYGWVAFYEFFTEIGILDNKDFNAFRDLISSNYYTMIQMDTVCVVVRNPTYVHLNEEKQLNSTKDYAIKFRDGWGMNFVNGFYMSDELFTSLKEGKYTFEEFANETNEEVKSACIAYMQQEFGDVYLFDFLKKNLLEIDTYVDKKSAEYLVGTTGGMNVGVYTLYKGEVNGVDIAYVRVWCHSTDRMFFLGVHPDNTKADDAIASLYTVPKRLKHHIVSINRQGERFSTVFTPKGAGLLSSLSTEDIQDTVSLTGTEYFGKMQYEY